MRVSLICSAVQDSILLNETRDDVMLLELDNTPEQHHDDVMRTTLDISEDLLRTAKYIAAEQKCSIGKVISDLAQRGLEPPPETETGYETRNGIRLLPRRKNGPIVTSELVKELLENEDF